MGEVGGVTKVAQALAMACSQQEGSLIPGLGPHISQNFVAACSPSGEISLRRICGVCKLPGMKLSVVMPVYNEKETIREAVSTVMSCGVTEFHQLVIVDDFSTDGTRDILAEIAGENPHLKVIYQDRNRGKGAALREGFKAAAGDIVVVQDADLEYDPKDFELLIGPIRDHQADVVYGSRFLGGGPHRVLFYWHYLGNKFLTSLSNMMTNLNLTDMEVCHKMFRTEVLRGLELKEDRFGFEAEITSKIAKAKWKIYEVPVSYYGRGYEAGKKITWKDGFRTLWCILKYRLSD
jgi:glycosyltransferase involved in cell wall biosynthesis